MGTTNRIDLSEYEDMFPDVGNRIRTNHINCPAGLDTKNRLEIKRKDNGDVLGYCHHCNGWGIKRDGMVRSIYSRPVSGTVLTPSSSYTLPTDLNLDVDTWPAKARVWPAKYGITVEELKKNSIGYSDTQRRVIIPCVSDTREYMGYQTRRIFDEDTKPKYLTYSKKGTKMFVPHSNGGTLPYIVLVEDALSAIKLSRVVKYPIAVLGADLSAVDLCAILTACGDATHAMVMFDNDNETVRRNQLKVAHRLQLLSPELVVRVCTLDRDPKELSQVDLEKVVNGS